MGLTRMILQLSFFVSGAVHLFVAHQRHVVGENIRQTEYVISKLIPMFCLILQAEISRKHAKYSYGLFILFGLIFSALGDYFLGLDGDFFIQGLASFFVAHILYVAAFGFAAGLAPVYLVLFGAFGVAFFLGFLEPNVPEDLKVPVIAYVGIIVSMAWRAFSRFGAGTNPTETGANKVGALGALSFVVSDAVLAWNKFVSPFAAANLVVMFFYYMGQYGIARSVLQKPKPPKKGDKKAQ
eukprot:NODE_1496_length_836_cov_67.558533_g1448_i0.p1 GENE.NODE_1496_length_836_cov_67.558533_g1448_i0~~NODE_1496_length_836_cov_67.558533_g1448_i0.p1  ORF type:complete len:239 (+),score=51.78 NODE_1496_length_836_cov_67.558533_g1448_i0:72-788(+)